MAQVGFVLLCFCISTTLQIQEFQDQSFKSGVTSGPGLQTLNTVTAASTLQCAVKCLLQDTCEAFTNMGKAKLCYIHNIITESSFAHKIKSEKKYFYKMKAAQQVKDQKVKRRILIAKHGIRQHLFMRQYNLKNNKFSNYRYVDMPCVRDVKYSFEMKTLFFAHGYEKRGKISSARPEESDLTTIRKLNSPAALCVNVKRKSIYVAWVRSSTLFDTSLISKMTLDGQSLKYGFIPKDEKTILTMACTKDKIFFTTVYSLLQYDLTYKTQTSFRGHGQGLFIIGNILYFTDQDKVFQYNIVNKKKEFIKLLRYSPKSILVHENKIYVTFISNKHQKMIDMKSGVTSKWGNSIVTDCLMTLF